MQLPAAAQSMVKYQACQQQQQQWHCTRPLAAASRRRAVGSSGGGGSSNNNVGSPRDLLRCAAAAQQSSGNSKKAASRPVFIGDSGTATFLEWARSQGISFGKLQPATFDGVRGLAAQAGIAADDIIVSVPRAAALTLPPKQRCPCPEFVAPAYWDAAPWFVKLGVRLLAEQRKGAASPLSQWLQQLPKQVDSPVNWSSEQLQQLRYTHLIHRVTEQQQEWAALYNTLLQQGLVKAAEAAKDAGSSQQQQQQQQPSRQEFFRALSLVRSRTFSGPFVGSTLQDRLRLAGLVAVLVAGNTLLGGDLSNGLGAAAAVFLFNIIYELLLSNRLKQYAMCPVIDLLNHSSSNTTEVSYDYPRDAFLVSAAAAYSAGQEVFISYGAQTNDSLLQMYGFVERDNPHDVYVSTRLLCWLEQLQPPCQARLDALNRAGLLGALQEVTISRAGFGAPTLQALRYLLAPPPAAAAAAAAGGGQQQQQQLPAGPPSSYEGAADAETEQRVALVLVHTCQQELAALDEPAPSAAAASTLRKGASSGARSTSSRGTAGSNGSSSSSGGNGTSSGSSSVSAATSSALAAAFRAEKRNVLRECLRRLTGDGGDGTGPAASTAQQQELLQQR